jgi:hypothetical protein
MLPCMDLKPIVFMKTDRLNLKFLNFEIKIQKLHFKNFGENRIQKLVSSRPRKIKEVCLPV